jgi:hypothetical protein
MYFALLLVTLLERVGLWAAAIVCGFGAGYAFGWTIPDWTIDEYLEGSRIGTQYYGGRSAYGAGGGGGCLLPFIILRFGRASGWLSNVASIVLIALAGWCVLTLWSPTDPGDIEYADFAIWFQKPLWATLAAAAAGYVLARVSDKGPVGPLE